MQELIFDRTQKDVLDRAKKGFLNFNDINRVEQWCEFIEKTLNKYHYRVNINVKTNWTRKDFLTVTQLERIKSNVETLKRTYKYYSTTPSLNHTGNMDYAEQNRIEKILKDLDIILINMQKYFVCSGVANCGQTRIWQVRYRTLHLWNTLIQNSWTDFTENDTWGCFV